jgi:hypothetical protein
MHLAGRSVPRHLLYSLVLVALTLGGVWIWARQNSYVPCISDCGETFISQFYARNYRIFGLAYGLVEDHATAPDSAAHPYYYTHNVNIGGLFYTLLEVLGVRPFWAKQLCVLFVFGVGVAYAYGAVAFHTRSSVIGLSTVILVCLDFGFFLSFAMHALRVWTWLAMFGLLYHVGRIAQSDRSRPTDLVSMLLFSVIAFGVGYEFWIICICISLSTLLFGSDPRKFFSGQLLGRTVLLLTLLLVPFALRQIQIMLVLGVDYWLTDFVYTVAVKVPFARHVFAVPSIEQIDAYYKALNVMRPPSGPLVEGGDAAVADCVLERDCAFGRATRCDTDGSRYDVVVCSSVLVLDEV